VVLIFCFRLVLRDKYKEEIVALLRNGSTKAFVADRYGTSQVNLYNWLKKNNLNVKQQNICVQKFKN
jgi:hypothetical protein